MFAAIWKSTPVLISVILLLIIILLGILAPVIAPHDPLRGSLRERNVPPAWLEGGSTQHLLGTDHLGRDVLSRLIYGARTLLAVSLAPVLAAAIVGAGLGIAAGYFGPRTAVLDIRLANLPLVLFAILPVLLAQFTASLGLVLVGTAGSGVPILVVLTALLPGIIFAHQAWRETLRTRDGDAVGLAREAGDSPSRVNIRHVLPRMATSLLLLVPLLMVYAIVLEGALGIFGAGVPPPIPAWGSTAAEGRDRLGVAWWISAFPALAILMAVFLLSLLANQFRGRLGQGPGVE